MFNTYGDGFEQIHQATHVRLAMRRTKVCLIAPILYRGNRETRCCSVMRRKVTEQKIHPANQQAGLHMYVGLRHSLTRTCDKLRMPTVQHCRLTVWFLRTAVAR